MATILEALENAEMNLGNTRLGAIGNEIGLNQLHNARVLIEKGYSPYSDVEDLLGDGVVEDVPEKEE